MGDHLPAGTPSRSVANHLGQRSHLPSMGQENELAFGLTNTHNNKWQRWV